MFIYLFYSLVLLLLFSSLTEILPKLGIGVASDSTCSLVFDYGPPNVPLYRLPPIPKKFTVLFELKFLKLFLEGSYCY